MAPKKSLQDEYVTLKLQHQHVETKYQQACSQVQQAFEEYSRCKNHFALRRYGELKDMIKDCIGIEVIKTSEGDDNNDIKSGIGLVGLAKQFRKECDDMLVRSEIKHDIEEMNNTDLKKHIEATKRQLSENNQKVDQLNETVMRLNREYEQSKRLSFFGKYMARKSMLKSFMRDSTTNFSPQR